MDTYKNIEQAIQNNELFSLLIGHDSYTFTNPYADTPTDPSRVMDGIISYYKQNGNEKILVDLKSAIYKLSEQEDLCWFALYYTVSCMRYEKREAINFENATRFYLDVVTNVKKNKSHLSKTKKWIGVEYNNGLWGDVQRMVKNINEEFNLEAQLEA
jgi:hypothetical protein